MKDGPDRRLTLLTCHPFDTVTPGGPGRLAVIAVSHEA